VRLAASAVLLTVNVTRAADRSGSGGVRTATPGTERNPSFSIVVRDAVRSQMAGCPSPPT
jgi:hypothetical protein